MDYKKKMKEILEKKYKAAMTDKRGPGMNYEKNKDYSRAKKASQILEYSSKTSSPSEYLGKALRKKSKKRRGRK